MSEIDPENDEIVENPAPEEDSDLVQVDGCEDQCLVTDQPEDDFCREGDQQLTLQTSDQPSASGPLPGAAVAPSGSETGDSGGHHVTVQDDGADACGLEENRESGEEKEEDGEKEHRQEQEEDEEMELPDLELGQSQNDLNDQPEDDCNNAGCGSASDRVEDGWSASADLPEDELSAGIPEDCVDGRNQVAAENSQDIAQPTLPVLSPEHVADLQEMALDDSDSNLNQASPNASHASEEGLLNDEDESGCDKAKSSMGADVGHATESESSESVSDSGGTSTGSAHMTSDSRKSVCQAPECDQSFQGSDGDSPTPQNNHEGSDRSSAGSSDSDGNNVNQGAESVSTESAGNLLVADHSAAEVDRGEKFQGAESSSPNDSAVSSAQEPKPDSSSTTENGGFPSISLGLCNSREPADSNGSPRAEDTSGDSAVAETASVIEADLASVLSALSPSSSENSTPNPASSPVKSTPTSPQQPPQQPSPSNQPPPRPPPPSGTRPQASSSATSLQQSSNSASRESLSSSTVNSNFEDDLLSELDAELAMPEGRTEQGDSGSPPGGLLLNGLKQADLASIPGLAELQQQLAAARRQLQDKDEELQRLREEHRDQQEDLAAVTRDKEKYQAQLQAARSKVSSDDLYLPQIKELEYTIAKQQTENRALKDKLASHDTAAKRAVATLQNELKLRIDQVTKMYDDCLKEKDTMVVRFAEAEQKNIDAKRHIDRLEAKLREAAKEKESLLVKARAAATDRQKAISELEAKSSELNAILKETEKLKDAASSAEYRIKWFQNKLKAELEAHKETKATVEKTNVKLKESREENAQIRRDCQAMIKLYQESEELKSNSLDKELRVKETLLQQQRQEKNDQTEVHQMTLKELEALKAQHKDHIEELKTLRDKVKCLEDERLQNEETLNKFKEIIQKQKNENHELQSKIAAMSQLEEECKRLRDVVAGLDRELEEVRMVDKDLQADMENCRRRESELLHLTEKLSNKNATLQSENTNLHNQVASLSAENTNFKREEEEIKANAKDLEEKFATEQRLREEETSQLKSELAAKTKECKDLLQQLEDEKDASRVLKRKHASNIKDLARQLQQSKRRLEAYESQGGDRETTSMGSRTSSNNSLHTIDSQQSHHLHPSRQPSQEQEHGSPEQVEVDKQVLIERIVKLQRAHARKNEKLDFLEDHIRQLVDQLQKKNRIIQNYALREEAGTLAPEFMDEHKLNLLHKVRNEVQALLSKKGGIMASVYSVHPQDGHMTMDLSLEINKKLQAVLEDTLLKNMTLKESLDTLGEEISRLSQENRQLQLKMQRQAAS